MNCMDLDYQFNNDSLILISQILLNYPTTIFEFLMKKMEIGESLELMIYIVEILKSTNGNVPGIVVNYEHLFELILDKDDYIHHASIFLEFQKNVNLDLLQRVHQTSFEIFQNHVSHHSYHSVGFMNKIVRIIKFDIENKWKDNLILSSVNGLKHFLINTGGNWVPSTV
jgi:hypothetical protein